MKILLLTVFTLLTLNAQANPWRHVELNKNQLVGPDRLPHSFNGRVSFTVSYLPPTYGLEQGAQFATHLYVEIFSVSGSCPEVAISQIYEDGSEKIYSSEMKQDAIENKCWVRIDRDGMMGILQPNGTPLRYFGSPIYLKSGRNLTSHRLYLKGHKFNAVFELILGRDL